MNDPIERIVAVLHEFTSDVEAAHGTTQAADRLIADWPDLADTYVHAKDALLEYKRSARRAPTPSLALPVSPGCTGMILATTPKGSRYETGLALVKLAGGYSRWGGAGFGPPNDEVHEPIDVWLIIGVKLRDVVLLLKPIWSRAGWELGFAVEIPSRTYELEAFHDTTDAENRERE